MRILDMIFYWAKAKPDHVAIIQPDMILTFKELAQRIEQAVEKIVELDLNPQEPVAVLIEHRARQLIVCFALMNLGLTMAPAFAGLLPDLRAHGINTIIHDGKNVPLPGSKNILFDDSWFRTTAKRAGRLTQGIAPLQEHAELIFFTSGSTGFPKKTIYPADTLLERLGRPSPLVEGSFARTLIVSGIDGSFGFFPCWAILSGGRTVCFAPIGEASLLLVSSHRIDYIIASPQQTLELVALAEKGGGYQLDSMKAFRLGGGIVTKALISRIQGSFCPNVVISYGSTEAGPMAFASYDTIANVPGAVGIIAPWAELEIVDGAGNVLPPGVEGQVRARTPNILQRLAAEKPEKKVDIQNVWYYPGDIGRLTEDGILCISGRVDDVLNRGGMSISAVDLDETLRSRAGIADAAVCGVMGDTGILQIWAGVVPQPDFDFDAFMQSLQEDEVLKRKLDVNLDRVLVVERIPRTQVGKIKRNELREMLLREKSAPRR